jgi:hypothetical protein
MAKTSASIASLLLFLIVSPLSSQDHPIEFGVDGGVSFFSWEDEDDGLTMISLPHSSYWAVGTFRLGFFLTPRVSLEPAVGLTRFSADDFSQTQLKFFPSVLLHFQDLGRVALPYVRGGAGLTYYGSEGSDGETQFGLGGGLGVKVPFGQVAFFRLEAGFEKWLERGDPETDGTYIEGFRSISIKMGISVILN